MPCRCCEKCPACCAWNGPINLPGGGQIAFGGNDDVNHAHCITGIFPWCDNVGLYQDIPAPGALYTQDPVGHPGDPCHEEDAFMEVLTWCSFDPNTQERPVFHLTYAIYVRDPITDEIICCAGPTDCGFACDPLEVFPYTEPICDGFSAEFS